MSNELKPVVMVPIRKRSPIVILGIIVGSIAALYLLLVLVGGMGWDGY
jgi:hypothetical protein